MTERLFWADSYLTEAEALVSRVDGSDVVLDRTVAFAESGGQESDTGTIGAYPILEARLRGDEIVYRLPDAHHLSQGERVTVSIDWPRRYRLMRLHFAAELVLETINRLFGHPEKTGAHISEDRARLDFAWEGSIASELPRVREAVRRLVAEDRAIESGFRDGNARLRFWRIEGFAQVPCGGTHLRRTSEVGAIELSRENPGRGRERVVIALCDPDRGLDRQAQ